MEVRWSTLPTYMAVVWPILGRTTAQRAEVASGEAVAREENIREVK